jgi:type I restriction enzyme M protein
LWFLTRTKKNGKFVDRRGKTLFIDTRKLGIMVDRVHRDLTSEEIANIARTYHAWRGETDSGRYEDTPGFCKSVTLEEIRKHEHVLTPGRYVGAEQSGNDSEPFEQKIGHLIARLDECFAESRRLEETIRAGMRGIPRA